MVKDKELTELQSINAKMAELSRKILSDACDPHRKEQLKELSELRESARLLRNQRLI
jgi:hypothetical protein